MQEQNAQALLLEVVEELIRENEIDKAIEVLLDLDKKAQAGISGDISVVTSNYRSATKEFRINQTISFEEYSRSTAKARIGLLELMKGIPKTLQLKSKLRSVDTYQFNVPDNIRLEKIIGGRNNILKINWLEKALIAAKSVCRVVNGTNLGTGFITKEGYLFTNNHVIKNASEAATTRVEFNYKESLSGEIEERTSYMLDVSTFIGSPPDQLDFTYIKVIDNPSNPLSNWGYVEIDPTAIPVNGDSTTILHYPKGGDLRLSTHDSHVVGIWNQFLFYETDTEPGSSGSPIFNLDWKVIALHHAGRTLAEGGIQINAAGDRAEANRGILFSHILNYIKNNGQSISDTKSQESFTISPKPIAVPQPTVKNEPAATPEVVVKQEEPVKTTVTEPTTITKPQPTPTPAPLKAFLNTPPKIVLVYDLQDAARAAQLDKHLTVLKLTKKIAVYNVQKVTAGEDVIASADREIASADFVFTLISSNLFNEEALWLIKSLEAIETGKKVIPVLLDKTDIDGTGLEKLRSLPSLNRTVSDFPNPEAAYSDIVEEIKRLIAK